MKYCTLFFIKSFIFSLIFLLLYTNPVGAGGITEEEWDRLNPFVETEKVSDEIAFFQLELEIFVKSATKIRQTISEAPSIISVITRDRILKHNYRSVAEALMSVPGLYVAYDYVFYDVGVRGISGELRGRSRVIKVMINGRPVSFRSETINFMGPELIPMQAIETIEIIRGPGSALYGANAYLCVVNIITRKGADIKGGSAGITGTMFFTNTGWDKHNTLNTNDNINPGIEGGLVAGYEAGPIDFMLSLQKGYQDRSGLKLNCTVYKDDPEYPDPCWDMEKKGIKDRASFDDIEQPFSFMGTMDINLDFLADRMGFESLGYLSFMGNFQSIDSRGSFTDWGTLNYAEIEEEDGTTTEVKDTVNRVGLNNYNISGEYTLPIFDELLRLKVGAGFASGGSTDHERLNDSEIYYPFTQSRFEKKAADGVFVEDRSEYGFKGKDTWGEIHISPEELWDIPIVEGPIFIMGGDYTEDNVTIVKDASKKEFGDVELKNTGSFGQLTFSLLDRRLGFVAGARRDDHSVYGEKYNYRYGVTILPVKEISIIDEVYFKALWGTAFKAPSAFLLYNDGILGQGRSPLNPNPELRPQDVDSLEFLMGGSLLKKRLSFSVNTFINNIKNKAVFSEKGTSKAIEAKNELDIESIGVEGDMKVRINPVEFYLNGAYQKSEKQFDEEDTDRIVETFGFPDFTANAGILFLIKRLKLVSGLDVQYVGKMVGTALNRSDTKDSKYELDGYYLLNLNITTRRLMLWDEHETRIAFSIKNLLNTEYNYPGFLPYYKVDIPGQPRFIMLTFEQSY